MHRQVVQHVLRQVYHEVVELLTILALGIALVVLIRVRRLNARVTHMETYLQTATKSLVAAPQPAQTEAPLDMQALSVPPQIAQAQPRQGEQTGDWFTAFLGWCQRDWLMKLGGLLVVLGAGWFVSYAFANNWVGPMGRVFLGVSVGALTMALGRYRIVRSVEQGSIVMFVGAVLVITTLYAARYLYDFYTPASVLVMMFGTSALLGVTSVFIRREELAYANVLLAGFAPILVAAPEPSLTGLFTYLLVMTVGALLIVFVTGWRNLVLVALGVVGVYSVPLLVSLEMGDKDMGLLFAFIFTGLFFASSLVAMYRARDAALTDLYTALGSGLFLLVWVLMAAPMEWQTVLLLTWAIVFAAGAYLVFTKTAREEHFYVYGAVAALYVAVGTALELDGALLTIVALGESATLIVLGYQITHQEKRIPFLALPLTIPMLLSMESIVSRAWQDGVAHADGAVLALMILVLASLAMFFESIRSKSSDHQLVVTLRNGAWVLAGAYALVFTWLAAHALFLGDTGTMLCLLVYALVGSGFYIGSKQHGESWQRLTAMALFAIVVGRLLLVDVWDMALSGRVITFLGIGILLMVVAWLERSAFNPQSGNK